MTGHHESNEPDYALSSDSVHRVTQYQTAGMNARLMVFALLQAQGEPATTWRPERSAAAQNEVVELGGRAPASRSPLFSDGWDDGVTAASEALVGIPNRDWSRSDGRSASAGAAEPATHRGREAA
ncbi:hypothetical protein [Streptomyces spectabilis]|uniref:Uncharacterized protein n=1 Tax=Streptomyces spectabilis TaxID=68270 RepID=A0A7W8B2I5_STRST|nr:hypothetical protein [Streptomyces spectabilis]MBB5109128.1 hypothetical protein [Streptomyces spectabilis]MCI3907826.1 hypothetical protein [Streptomyces spectabilis]MCI3907829.1 hypothetical protein [Streptomyces spectabilis]GGV51012.1 hypothetical protein GCM10010245_80180 [Streptomyces spectabilis]